MTGKPDMLRLYIANKNYSSWSFRPWLAMKVAGIEFEEVLVPFDVPGGNPQFAAFSPTNKVPVLVDGDETIWESLAILDHLARKYPEAGLWPDDPADRSQAMAMSCEMISAFVPLRSDCPLNMRRPVARVPVSPALAKDVARINTLWSERLAASGGPFLFGDFTLVDAMFAPVVSRFQVYALEATPIVQTYMQTISALPEWQEWEAAAHAEPWVVDEIQL